MISNSFRVKSRNTMNCPNCEDGKLVYQNANESKCNVCNQLVPNAHLPK